MIKFKSISLMVCMFLVFAILFSSQPSNAKPLTEEDSSTPKDTTISVTGSADVMIVPDEVVITLGIDTRDKDIVKAKTENDKRVNQILNIAKEFKIDSKNIQTDYIDIRPGDISIKPIYEGYYEKIDPVNMGYVARKKIVITLKDFSVFENFITEVVKNGAEYINGVEFRSSELRKHKDNARELAIKAAREKADAMSGALGQKAGKAVFIREDQESYWSWHDSWYGGSYRSTPNLASNYLVNAAQVTESSGSQGIEPGKIKVSARVSVDFSLE